MAGKVKPIDRQSVHQICSGQVVLNLATAVKELVENSLDAGATSIEIRLKNHGSELLEVIDNGSGVKKENFEALTLKHHTSKLNDFSDLAGVSTFGFRGEALSSLCALSDLTITTCHTSVAIGTKFEYDHDGLLVKQTPISRQPGTTVSLQNIFSTFPVRHKEFLRNVKKEFCKMVHLFQAYCLISTGVRITCTNQVGTGRKSVVAQTHNNSCIRDNISNIYGPKALQNLLDLKQSEPSIDCCEEFGVKICSQDKSVFSISGYISSCEHGSGRSSADRQYYFINTRPCDFPKVSKLVNEVYHMYNRHQYPMVVLNITLQKDYVDVNLTPDKRKILVQEEKTLLAVIKTSLVKLFEPLSSTYQLKQPMKSNLLPSSFTSRMKCDSVEIVRSGEKPMSKVTKATLSNLKRSFSHPDAEKNDTLEKKSKCPKLDNFFTRLPSQSDNETSDDISAGSPEKVDELSYSNIIDINPKDNTVLDVIETNNEEFNGKTDGNESYKTADGKGNHEISLPTSEQSCIIKVENFKSFKELKQESSQSSLTNSFHDSPVLAGDHSGSGDLERPSTDVKLKSEDSFEAVDNRGISEQKLDIYVDEASTVLKKNVTIPFSFEGLKKCLVTEEVVSGSDANVGSFHASIIPADNTAAESELVRHISKDMFCKMEILGQFNLGFIIAKLKSDLFIIDQHATDEKFNFETFQRTTTLQSQKLIQPMRLELTAVNESILMDNIDIFRKNGFEFEISEDAPLTQKVKLVSLPISKNWTFGTDDINEMIFMLMDAPGTMCRPSRVRQMFASRACRSSVMIGTALNQSDMKKLVHHMGEIDQPWNCPHGRPTMRHLINLKMLPD
ncbi:mismatch repair endonuclease PMS2-like isoform X3 [Anneissia japonica]|uniref:mismatch repair endonuclease PMS2-like isoform X1 n=1 Tax=Anneissia japonica TaxID=1529436 RepID=UPI0014257643|nr:mismatch repair endonuclease PMS2-like isoform X1 [Anneissia japonica]XP_033118948.1 mismatch repair endonuclease PMS2-like isoform X2 [Anneissia japonica]XP_033118949.1 mismatch repair endonuclease PMS2-like isoform X3 [Anneissia japonica]